jgi:hypothetical protein
MRHKMKRRILQTTLLSLALAGLVRAGALDTLTVTLDTPSGALTGNPGATVGWGFTATWTPGLDPTYWASITSVNLIDQTNAVGVFDGFVDFMSPQGGPFDYAFAPSGPNATWTQAFDAVSQGGVGAYTIRADAVPLALDTGYIQITYDVFDGDPLLGGQQQGGDQTIAVPYSVQVAAVSEVPEPGAWLLVGPCLALLLVKRRR